MKILAVDDDELSLELFTLFAGQAGFRDLVTVSSAEDAVHLLKTADADFDCLMLDINMPDINGIELCAIVRAMPHYEKTPIIMLTGVSEKNAVDRAFRAGATDYVTKPFDIVELHARLRMAEELLAAPKIADLDASMTDDVQGKSRRAIHFDLAEELHVRGVEHLISYTALSNYLTQLSRAGIASTQVVAVKIDRIEAIHSRASTEEFLYALAEVADMIGEVFGIYGCMMAYAGNGAFVVVSGKATMESSIGLEGEIQVLLDEKESEYDNGDPLDLDISMGNPIRPSPGMTQRIRKTFDRAVARAESRVQKKRCDPLARSIRLVSG
jgi:CheY-like chemotaxis protein